MSSLYTKPLRVYVILGALALWGIWSGLSLPVSLFPANDQAILTVSVPYGSLSATQFFDAEGRGLEARLQGIKVGDRGVKRLEADYRSSQARYKVEFDWGADPNLALREVENAVNARFASADPAVRRGLSVNRHQENQGFFAVSFYSPQRSVDEMHRLLEPLVTPMTSQVPDAQGIGLFNPNRKEIAITLHPERLARFEVGTGDVQRAIQSAVVSLNGGILKIGDRRYNIEIPRAAANVDEIARIPVPRAGKPAIALRDLADVTVRPSPEGQQIFKTSGVDSLILFANPAEGGNLKSMSDAIMRQLEILRPQWPADIDYRIIVNPAEFIDKSISGVVHEVVLAAFLAVVVLFVFIGSFRNVVTAAIEIPLSLLLAFILMRLTGMNLNLISLGGLALSAGMNVDASVVVLENIVRHFEGKGPLSVRERVAVLVKAVDEVRLPIIASTIASLVVFMPLIFTHGMTHSLLGDLAKAVIFSHGLSAVVALVLVPTIRLNLMNRGVSLEAHSPFEKWLFGLENLYRRSLGFFLRSGPTKALVFGLVILALPALMWLVLPKLKKEIIGRPESDWLMVGVSSPLFTNIKETESEVDVLDQELRSRYPDDVLYTFVQIWGVNGGMTMLRLKDRRKLEILQTEIEGLYKNTPTKFYWAEPWNPSELRIPDPPQFRVEVTGGSDEERNLAAQETQSILQEKGVFDRVRTEPQVRRETGLVIERSPLLAASSDVLSNVEISHLLRVATDGLYLETIYEKQAEYPVYLRFPKDAVDSVEKIKALPIGFEGRMIPLGALARVSFEELPPGLYRENQRSLILITGRLDKARLGEAAKQKEEASQLVQALRERMAASGKPDQPALVEAVADMELRTALDQLKIAIAVSILLVFLIMVIQLGDVVHSLLVLVAIPLGFIGVCLSLWIFSSSLSLNSGLGTILLNGIAVANSIILVDFIRRLHESGRSAYEATLEASVTRMRPILMTSLTTVLGMFPIALGMGEGGKILQPLGIAVCGGLWVSTLLTLYLVPALQHLYLRTKERR